MATPTSRARIAPLDCLRVLATACVVLLHACVPYATHPMPGLVWPVRDQTSRLVDTVFWGIELFVMPVFLVMAGYFTVGLLRNRNAWQVICHRFRGLMFPFAFAAIFLLPLSLYAWLTGWVIEGQIPLRKVRSLAFEGGQDRDLWGFAHLWFLPYLFLYIFLFVAFVGLRRQPCGARETVWLRRGSVAGLALLGIATVFWSPQVVFGFQHGFLPFPSKSIYCGSFFLGGIWLGHFDSDLQQLARRAPRYLLVGGLAAAVAVWSGTRMLSGGDDTVTRMLMAVSSVSAAWSITMGLHGWVIRRQFDGGPVLRYLAAASFWVYLFHHSVVALLHIDLKVLLPEASPLLKAGLAFSLACGFCLLVFEGLVRRSPIGRLLGVKLDSGIRREPATLKFPTAPVAPASPHEDGRAA